MNELDGVLTLLTAWGPLIGSALGVRMALVALDRLVWWLTLMFRDRELEGDY